MRRFAQRAPLVLPVLLVVTFSAPGAAQFPSEHDRREAIRHYRNGRELMTAERFEQAVDAFRAAIASDRLLSLAHHGLGEAYMALRRYASAIQAFTGAREALVTLHGLHDRHRVEVERHRDEEIRELNDSIRRLRQIPNTNLQVARLEARIQDLERQRSSNTDAFVPPAELLLALGSAYFRNNQLEDAEREWRAAMTINNRFGEVHNNLAALYAMTGRKKEAQESVRAAERAGFRVNPQLKQDIDRLH